MAGSSNPGGDGDKDLNLASSNHCQVQVPVAAITRMS